jgi:hypothetical protein
MLWLKRFLEFTMMLLTELSAEPRTKTLKEAANGGVLSRSASARGDMTRWENGRRVVREEEGEGEEGRRGGGEGLIQTSLARGYMTGKASPALGQAHR